MRMAFAFFGILLTVVGVIGVIVPFLPGTPLLIAAAACFARSSRRLESYLVNHKSLGSPIRAWRERGAIPFPAKLAAIAAMGISALLTLAATAPLTAKLFAIAALAGAAAFIATRPETD